jgi:hypothetical protein
MNKTVVVLVAIIVILLGVVGFLLFARGNPCSRGANLRSKYPSIEIGGQNEAIPEQVQRRFNDAAMRCLERLSD